MIQSLHSDLSVEGIDSHSLLGHSALKSVFGGLIMIGEGND